MSNHIDTCICPWHHYQISSNTGGVYFIVSTARADGLDGGGSGAGDGGESRWVFQSTVDLWKMKKFERLLVNTMKKK